MGLEYVPSQANFVLVKVGDGNGVFKALMAKGRHRARHGVVSIAGVDSRLGRHDAQNRRFIDELQELLAPAPR